MTQSCNITRSSSYIWPVVGLSWAAFALRIALARGDLWGDEAASVMLSLRPTSELLATLASAEPHPPLYPLLLKVWLRLAGTHEFVARFPSLAAGVLAVPVAAALGRAISNRVAVTAALLTALNPFLLWYTTEARMYGLSALAAGVSSYWLLRLLATDRHWGPRAAVLGYAATAALALLIHYFLLFVGAAHALLGLLAVLRRPQLLPVVAAAGALALVPAALWAAYASRIVGSYYGAQPGTVDLLGVLTRTWLRLPVGWSAPDSYAELVGLVLTPVVGLGAALAWRQGPDGRRWIALLAIPLLAGLGVSLVRPMYQERYLAVVALPYLLLLALAVSAPRRALARAALLAIAVAATVLPLWNLAAGRYVRSQYGSHAAEANALATPGEAAILTGPSQAPLYEYYASREGAGLPVYGLPRGSPAPEPATSRELGEITAEHRGLWLFLYAVADYDPANIVERYLTERAYRAPARWTVNGRLIHFATEATTPLAPPAAPVSLGPHRLTAALPAARISAGGLLPIRLELDLTAPMQRIPKLRLRLLDGSGFIWGEADEVLGAGFLTPLEVAPGRPRIERRAVAVLAGAEGQLRVEAQLYVEEPDGARPLGTANLGPVNVAPSDRFWAGQIAGFQAIDGPVDAGWRLFGWASSPSARTGERAYVTTLYRAAPGAATTTQQLRLHGPLTTWTFPIAQLRAAIGAPAPSAVAAIRTSPLAEAAPGTVRRLQLAPPIPAG